MIARLAPVVALLCLATSLAEARPRLLTNAELDAGADAIVRARVISVDSGWTVDRTGLETRVELEVLETIAGAVAHRVAITQPGGELADGTRHVIAGMPTYAVGLEGRFHLRRKPDGTFRVYGWEQGLEVLSGALPFAHNGMQWQPAQIPVPFFINENGSDDVDAATSRAAILRAFARWADVPCSTLTFEDMGDTDLGMAVDGTQVIMFIESGWNFGEEAAGAASLFFAPGETPTADIALNGEGFTWADGVPSVGPATQDIEGVMTHELGHFVGLGHTQRSIDTMYFGWTPWQSQRTLSADDKLGLCALYPTAAPVDECQDASECEDQAPCESFASGNLCSPAPDPLGADCDNNRVECESFCLYTVANLSAGFCSRFCDELDCPPGFECMDASAGDNPVRVCFKAAACDDATPCAAGRFCGDDGVCTFECRDERDCDGDSTCDGSGRCQLPEPTEDGGCGCSSGGSGSGAWLLLLALCAARRRVSHR